MGPTYHRMATQSLIQYLLMAIIILTCHQKDGMKAFMFLPSNQAKGRYPILELVSCQVIRFKHVRTLRIYTFYGRKIRNVLLTVWMMREYLKQKMEVIKKWSIVNLLLIEVIHWQFWWIAINGQFNIIQMRMQSLVLWI